ncbi:MAG: response regulator transcription factor [Erysipelotrichaceae bacterium]|nr:response regulator transcription factor [Erysipelotrichaceae bacterium]
MRILLVEDESQLLNAYVKGLKQDGYAIDTAGDGASAVELCEINTYDLVVLDINLPKLNGIEVLKQVRTLNKSVKIIIVSANRSIEQRIEGLDLGANDYLTKPFDFQELRARIRALLRRDFISQPKVLTINDFNIDLNLHQITYQGKMILLTLKEYTILTYLIQNRERIISSEELLEKCWNDEADPFSEAMRVHIYALRKKIQEATQRDDVIQTVKGVGYRFNP